MADKPAKVFGDPLDFDELFPGRFIKAGDFKGEKVTLRISKVKLEELVGEKGALVKGLISFERTEKQLALNKTNGICFKEMFGRKVQEWVGHRVTLFAGMWDGEPCIRVWGSPELERDREITIQLPRKRPIFMTMHKTLPKGATPATTERKPEPPPSGRVDDGLPTDQPASSSGEPGDKPSAESAKEQLRAAQTAEALKVARKTVWALYAAAQAEVPLEVEAFANARREILEQQE